MREFGGIAVLHCRIGMIVPGAYQTLKQLRRDIPESASLAAIPLFDGYHAWHEATH